MAFTSSPSLSSILSLLHSLTYHSIVFPPSSHVHSFYIGEITLALEHLHTNGIIYRYLMCLCTCMQTPIEQY